MTSNEESPLDKILRLAAGLTKGAPVQVRPYTKTSTTGKTVKVSGATRGAPGGSGKIAAINPGGALRSSLSTARQNSYAGSEIASALGGGKPVTVGSGGSLGRKPLPASSYTAAPGPVPAVSSAALKAEAAAAAAGAAAQKAAAAATSKLAAALAASTAAAAKSPAAVTATKAAASTSALKSTATNPSTAATSSTASAPTTTAPSTSSASTSPSGTSSSSGSSGSAGTSSGTSSGSSSPTSSTSPTSSSTTSPATSSSTTSPANSATPTSTTPPASSPPSAATAAPKPSAPKAAAPTSAAKSGSSGGGSSASKLSSVAQLARIIRPPHGGGGLFRGGRNSHRGGTTGWLIRSAISKAPSKSKGHDSAKEAAAEKKGLAAAETYRHDHGRGAHAAGKDFHVAIEAKKAAEKAAGVAKKELVKASVKFDPLIFDMQKELKEAGYTIQCTGIVDDTTLAILTELYGE